MTLTRNQIIARAGIVLLLVLAWFLRSVIAYFLVALVVSFIGAPLMRFFEKRLYIRGRKIPSAVSAILVLLTFITVAGAFVAIVLPPLAEQVAALSNISHTDLEKSFGEPLQDLRNRVESAGLDSHILTVEYFKEQFRDMLNVNTLSTWAGNLVSALSSATGWIFIVLFISFFLLKEKYLFYRMLHVLTPVKHEDRMQRIMRNLNEMLGRYFRSLLLQVVVFGAYIFIGLSIVGEKYALTVAIFSGLVNLISYIGPVMGLTFALLFSVFSHIGASFYGVILPEMYQVTAVYLAAIMLDNFFSYPLIFSNSLKVHPLELFFVILAGAQLGGLGGMMLAAPLYTVIRIFAKEMLSQFEVVKSMTKNI